MASRNPAENSKNHYNQIMMGRIKEIVKNNPAGLIARAFLFSEKAHAAQKRKSGDPYFTHVAATANILSLWHLDDATIAAGLLHDTVEDTEITLEVLKKEFGEEVAFLVDGVTKLGRIKYRGAEGKVENLRKMILALSQDLRVVFIKLADRLHNMRTLNALPPAKQKRIALETDEIYAPLAYRLGMQNLAGELQDLAFPYLFPREYRWLRETTKEQYEERVGYIEKMKPELEMLLKEHGINPVNVDFRAKRYGSLYKKLLRHGMDLGNIYDLVAMRIIVETIPECYAALGIIHEKWPPLPGRIKDYIAMPKPNNYRSLHTTIIGPGEKIVEFQIRTKEMHDENEYGVAAHWLYEQKKRGEETPSAKKITEEVRWVQQLKNWIERYRGEKSNPEEFLDSMKIDFFRDRIFVITPKGDVIDLPAEATPVDFAYHIHSAVGDTCVGAKVNNQLVPLNHKLSSGDLVEIITQKNKKPSESWLAFVTTSLARDHIKAALRVKNTLARGARLPTKAELRIAVEDRVGLIKDISVVIARSHVNILNFEVKNQPGSRFHMNRIGVGTTDKQKIEKLLLKIKNVNGVKEVGYKLI
jgi:GTP diphosphokinase / guanosine-3',5'-bis(diphosphate) 3'-diphosphatase